MTKSIYFNAKSYNNNKDKTAMTMHKTAQQPLLENQKHWRSNVKDRNSQIIEIICHSQCKTGKRDKKIRDM